VRILAVAALLGLTASCAWPPPEAAAPPPAPSAVIAEPAPLVAPLPPVPVVAVAPVVVAAASAPPEPPREVEYVPVPLLWWRMLTTPLPAGRLMLNNFSFEPTRVQAVLVSGPACTVGDGGAVTEFALPSNGTRIVPAPPGFDICWRRALTTGEANETPGAGPWTGWSRAYTGPGRFLDAVIVIPPQPPAVAVAVEKAPPPPPSPEPSS
jgi:hypothetical protein